MITRDQVREVLRTLPDDYLSRYVKAFEEKRLSCFEGNVSCACAITIMAGVEYSRARNLFGRDSAIEHFYENLPNEEWRAGGNATPLYDECVMELARRAAPVPAEVVR